MKTYTNIDFTADTSTVCALGCFDGIHLGHAHIINEAKRIAASLSIASAVWSFREPPKNYFSKDKIKLLTSPEEKRLAMQALGVDIFVCIPFDENISSLPARTFFEDILIKRLNVRHIVCGFNYRFGKGGEGTAEMLKSLCAEAGIGLSVIPPITSGELTVSSSEIRTALCEGDISCANALLGRAYSLRAKVIDGQHLGRTLGFPTVNQQFSKSKLLPRNGVYVSRIRVGRKLHYGITNIGLRPTVNGKELCAETNIFDFTGDLYGRTLTVELLAFLRPEQKFSSIDELSNQVYKDIDEAHSFIRSLA